MAKTSPGKKTMAPTPVGGIKLSRLSLQLEGNSLLSLITAAFTILLIVWGGFVVFYLYSVCNEMRDAATVNVSQSLNIDVSRVKETVTEIEKKKLY